MKWQMVDIDSFLQSREYVDTAVVPLLSVSFDEELKRNASKADFIKIVSQELERQLKGRIMLLPPFVSLKNDDIDLDKLLKKWKDTIKQHFQHVIFLTCEERWRKEGDEFIWIPSIPIEHMDQDVKRKVVQDQIEQIMNILLQYWNRT
ncbi:MAG: DUF2487 domain-containing protein [Bacillaceae bacterium]|uniref:YpiF family protein n=1 Tax=Aeribacillus TaxID=1055323 RepID=UPI000E38C504|nr:YpiF family protein [Aeribacillus composti]AXI40004.1 DUF2487 domain-containing protein [Bacillaceae bacterium ZC4]REJ17362.1 MAG: DUF2487 domain-containing protein [Bacillaceae bacterium]TVZ79156.1 uncharacterized protein DUF2487 [Aeribacillus composti]